MESKRLIKTKGLKFSCEEYDYKTMKQNSLLKHQGLVHIVTDSDRDRLTLTSRSEVTKFLLGIHHHPPPTRSLNS